MILERYENLLFYVCSNDNYFKMFQFSDLFEQYL